MKISNSVLSKVVRLGSVAALSATFIVGVSSTASAQGYGQSNGRDWRDSQQNNDNNRDWRNNGGQRWDRNGQFNDRNLGRNRHQYSYDGRAFDYTVDSRRGSEDAREVAQQASQNGYQQGIQDGQYDASVGASKANPSGHGAYQFALDGWSQDWGSGSVYQSTYRQAYVRGYNEAFSRSQRPGRRF